jgi:hypothetical protein
LPIRLVPCEHPKPTVSAAAFTDALRHSRVMEAGQVNEFARELLPGFSEPRALTGELIRRGWLTPCCFHHPTSLAILDHRSLMPQVLPVNSGTGAILRDAGRKGKARRVHAFFCALGRASAMS